VIIMVEICDVKGCIEKGFGSVMFKENTFAGHYKVLKDLCHKHYITLLNGWRYRKLNEMKVKWK